MAKTKKAQADDSDEEYYNVTKRNRETHKKSGHSSEQILTDILASSLDFGKQESNEIEKFYNKYKETLKEQSMERSFPDPGNILHVLAKDSSPDGKSYAYWTREKLVEFLQWILQDHSGLLEGRIERNKYPLQTAFGVRNDVFIHTVLELKDLKNVKNVLTQKTRSHRNYIQVAVLTESPLVADFARKCADLTLPVWNGSKTIGKESETPLHLAVRKVFPVHKELSLEDLRVEVGSTNPSPMVEIYTTWKQKHVVKLPEKNVGSPENMVNANQPHEEGSNAIRRVDTSVSEPSGIALAEDVAGLLLLLVQEYHRSANPMSQAESAKAMSQVDVVKLFMELAQDSLECQSRTENEKKVGVRQTPYQERITQLRYAFDDLIDALKQDKIIVEYKLRATKEDVMQMIVADDPVTDAIRYHCLRYFDRDKIARCLYQPGEERHIDFDLAGLRSPSISNAFLKRLAKHLRFESTLKYVALPKLALEGTNVDTEEQNPDPRQSGGRHDPNDLRIVFRWLRRNNVKRILRVTVVDYGSPCHSDSVIEKALEGFQVEIWDWKKVDLCTDVIATSTPEARDVSLYSSNNNAVLMGWASSDGLGDGKKFPKLEHVRLFIAKGQEGDRRAAYIQSFKAKVEAIVPPETGGKNVTVEPHLDDGKVSFAADFKNNEISEQQEVEWISQVKNFSQFMKNIPPRERGKIAPIKIAIIDDGVDASLDLFVGQIAGGKSFCPYASSSDLMNAYYVPSGQHGTMMADLICQICPSCRLYVARLDERPSRSDSSRQITMESAAEAVKWAVDCGVDIISMSWTIDGTSADAKDVNSLKGAIEDAKKKNIIMFCSTSDHGSISSDNYYPAKTNECIRIGAATAFGDKCTWVPEQYDYLLPGKNVPFKWNRSDGTSSWYESGSSLSTALAAGLAGLLLYCDRAVSEDSTDATREQLELRTKPKMSTLFHNLALSSKDHKFVRANGWFDGRFRKYVQEEEAPKKLSEMEWSPNSKAALKRLLFEMKNES